ncbi:MAG: universal stress protein [Alcaligenaceae bacterium]|nr:universal stress protein [Alcaligenaceae bacterium]
MAKTILVPFDGSSNANKALDWAISLAKVSGFKILLLNVQPSFRTVHAKTFFNKSDLEEYQQQLFKEATEGVEDKLKTSGIPYNLKLDIGDPKERIVEEVRNSAKGEDRIELIVMGSRGTNPVFSGVLGSVSYAIINAGVCPVTIIPQEKK